MLCLSCAIRFLKREEQLCPKQTLQDHISQKDFFCSFDVCGLFCHNCFGSKKGAWRITTWHIQFSFLKNEKSDDLCGLREPVSAIKCHILVFLIPQNIEKIISYTGLTGFGEFVPQIMSNDELCSFACCIPKMLTIPSNSQLFPSKMFATIVFNKAF